MSPDPSRVGLIVAMARNGAIGRDGDLPWRLPEDWKHFRRTTMGHALLMGRRTWESLPGALPGRHAIVISRDTSYRAEGARTVTSLELAIAAAREIPGAQPILAGGAQIYAEGLPLASQMWLTRVDADVPGDTFFPDWDESAWQCTEQHPHPADDKHAYPFTIEHWLRPTPP